jgi:hypothetical protein
MTCRLLYSHHYVFFNYCFCYDGETRFKTYALRGLNHTLDCRPLSHVTGTMYHEKVVDTLSTDRRLGGPLHRQLANQTHAHPIPMNL